MEAIKSTINGFLSDQMRAIWNTWLVIQVLLFAFTICAIAAASDTKSVSYGFFAIWTVLCCMAYSVGGTMVLRNLEMRTPLAVGFMLGVGVTLVNMLLVLAVMSGEGPMCDGKPSSVGAVEAFATLMLMGYSVFLGMTYQFRNTLLPPPMTGGDAEQGGLPPATQFGSSEGQFAGNSGGFTDASIGGSSNLPGGVL